MKSVWRLRLLGAAMVPVVVYAAMTIYMALNERRLVYMPDPVHVSPADLGLRDIEEVRLKTPDGLTILTWVARPKNGAPTIAYFHGNGGSFKRRHDRIRKLNSFGYGVAMLGYRGYSGSEGSPTEEGLYTDARTLMNWLNAQGYADRDLVLYGQSLGTGVATKMAAERRVAAVVLEAPYTSTADVAAVHFPIFPVHWLMRDQFRSMDRIRDVQSPILIIHGGRDSVIPQAQGRALLAAAREPKAAFFPPLADHLDAHLHGSYDHVRAFLAQYAKGPAP